MLKNIYHGRLRTCADVSGIGIRFATKNLQPISVYPTSIETLRYYVRSLRFSSETHGKEDIDIPAWAAGVSSIFQVSAVGFLYKICTVLHDMDTLQLKKNSSAQQCTRLGMLVQ